MALLSIFQLKPFSTNAQPQFPNSKLFLHWVSNGTNNFWTSTKVMLKNIEQQPIEFQKWIFHFDFASFARFQRRIYRNFSGRKNTEKLAQQHRCQHIMKTTTTAATKQTESLIENSSVLASPSSEYIIKLFMFMRLRTSAANGVIKLSNLFYICVPCRSLVWLVWLGSVGIGLYRAETIRMHSVIGCHWPNEQASNVKLDKNKKNTPENDINILELILCFENIVCFI